jgi:hypothetical protein
LPSSSIFDKPVIVERAGKQRDSTGQARAMFLRSSKKCLFVSLAYYRHTKQKRAAKCLPVTHQHYFGWEAGIRTPIGGFPVLKNAFDPSDRYPGRSSFQPRQPRTVIAKDEKTTGRMKWQHHIWRFPVRPLLVFPSPRDSAYSGHANYSRFPSSSRAGREPHASLKQLRPF